MQRSPMTSARHLAGCALLLLAIARPGQARAEPADEIDDKVAAALYDRGMVLFEQGDAANAKKMFAESLERSPRGSRAQDALHMLRAANEKLGMENLEHGRPARSATEAPLDPYDSDPSAEQPLDPYAADESDEGALGPLDPYGPTSEAGSPAGLDAGPADAPANSTARKGLMLWSGLYGFELGLALGGPLDESGDISGGAILLGALGAGGSVALSYWLQEKYSLRAGQSAAIASAGTWGAYNIGMLGDVFSGDDSATNTVHNYVAAGGLLGVGAGAWYAFAKEPSTGSVSFLNSMSMVGTSAGLLLGVAIDPPRSEAYSLNAAFGSTIGIGAGLYFLDRGDVSRSRMFKVDIGAAAGAASTWVLLYPLMSDEGSTTDEQVAGFLSTLTMLGGAGLAWYLTADDAGGASEPLQEETSGDPAHASAPALVQRGAGGSWRLGAPLVRPMLLPELAPSQGTSLGVDLLSGRF